MGFKNLFWGFIFLFDLRIGGFDILPDFIAYILFYRGMNMLSDRNENFDKGKVFAIPLIFLSIFDIFQVSTPITEIRNISFGGVGVLIGIGVTIINLMMIYNSNLAQNLQVVSIKHVLYIHEVKIPPYDECQGIAILWQCTSLKLKVINALRMLLGVFP